MPQLHKAIHKTTRYKTPCCVRGCVKADQHATWQHGKTDEEVFAEQDSRANNPRDPKYDGRHDKDEFPTTPNDQVVLGHFGERL